jgi:transcription elongation factor Elf1
MNCPVCETQLQIYAIDDQDKKIGVAVIRCPKCNLQLNVIWPQGYNKQPIIIPGNIETIAN